MKILELTTEQISDLELALITAMRELDKFERDVKIADRLEILLEYIRNVKYK